MSLDDVSESYVLGDFEKVKFGFDGEMRHIDVIDVGNNSVSVNVYHKDGRLDYSCEVPFTRNLFLMKGVFGRVIGLSQLEHYSD